MDHPEANVRDEPAPFSENIARIGRLSQVRSGALYNNGCTRTSVENPRRLVVLQTSRPFADPVPRITSIPAQNTGRVVIFRKTVGSSGAVNPAVDSAAVQNNWRASGFSEKKVYVANSIPTAKESINTGYDHVYRIGCNRHTSAKAAKGHPETDRSSSSKIPSPVKGHPVASGQGSSACEGASGCNRHTSAKGAKGHPETNHSSSSKISSPVKRVNTYRKCPECGQFKHKRSLARHREAVHGIRKQSETGLATQIARQKYQMQKINERLPLLRTLQRSVRSLQKSVNQLRVENRKLKRLVDTSKPERQLDRSNGLGPRTMERKKKKILSYAKAISNGSLQDAMNLIHELLQRHQTTAAYVRQFKQNKLACALLKAGGTTQDPAAERRKKFLFSLAQMFGGNSMTGRKKYREIMKNWKSLQEDCCWLMRYCTVRSHMMGRGKKYENSPLKINFPPWNSFSKYEVKKRLLQCPPKLVQPVEGYYRSVKSVIETSTRSILKQESHSIAVGEGPLLKFVPSKPRTLLLRISSDEFPWSVSSVTGIYLTYGNLWKRTHSPSFVYPIGVLLAKESSINVASLIMDIMEEVTESEKQGITVDVDGTKHDFDVEFMSYVADQKGLCVVLGEVSNSATRFSSFADVIAVSSEKRQADFAGCHDHNVIRGYIGEPEDAHATWHPVSYEERKKHVAQCKKLWAKHKKLKDPRQAIMTEMQVCHKCRQVEENYLGKYCENIYPCALHLSLLLWANWLSMVDIVVKEMIPTCAKQTKFTDLPDDHILVDLSKVILENVKSTRISKYISQNWNAEAKGLFDGLRLQGLQVHQLCRGFQHITELVYGKALSAKADRKTIDRIFFLHYFGVLARDITSLMNRTSISEVELKCLESKCSDLHAATVTFQNAVFMKQNIWTIGHVVPFYAWKIYGKYGIGPGVNNMEATEHKHKVLKSLLKNTQPGLKRWDHVFINEFVTTQYLPGEIPSFGLSYKGSKLTYSASNAAGNCTFCKLSDCSMCLSADFKKFVKTAQQRTSFDDGATTWKWENPRLA